MVNKAGIVFLALFSSQVFADEAAISQLVKMNDALHRMNYSGTLVHIKGDDVNTLHVTHELKSGVATETVNSLNGENHSVSSQTQTFSLAKVPQSLESMKAVYSLDIGAMKTVAMRPCQMMIARPKDKMRYLQKYCLDKQTGLPLDYALIDNNHKTVERFTFTNVNISEPVSEVLEQADLAQGAAPPQTLIEGHAHEVGDWTISELPKGFSFGKLALSQEAEVKRGPDTEHFMLTDGLSSVSIFISPIATAQPKVASTINSGALNVLTSQKNNHRITLVGEIPRATMQSIFANLIYQGGN
ncbi:MAG: MucB/RseB C-terminal domain-containing protein [Leucothrix sp.]